jgi:hypothetical protein
MMKKLFRSRSDLFKTRSLDRDILSDSEAVRAIAVAIDRSLQQTEAERTGLKRRIEDVIARAAIVGGNESDEHLERTKDRSEMLRDSDAEIRRGENRLATLDENIGHFKFLKAALRSRFPDLKL